MSNAYPYPDLHITEYEKQFVGHYDVPANDKTGWPAKPGVLKRVYLVELFAFNTADGISPFPTQFPTQQLTRTVQIARRSKICAIVPIGDVERVYVNIRNASGESYTPSAPAPSSSTQPLGMLVASMQAGSAGDASANGGGGLTNNDTFISLPVTLDPAWELSPNQTLIFEAALAPGVTLQTGEYLYVGFGVHVWEYPGMSGR